MVTKNRQFIETLEICGRFDRKRYLSYQLDVIFETELDLVKLLKLYLELYNGNELITVLCHLLFCFKANKVSLEKQKILIDKVYKILKSLEDILNEHDLGNMGFKLMDKVASDKCGIFESESEIDEYLKEQLVIDITSNTIIWVNEVLYNIQKEYLKDFKSCLSISDINRKEIASIEDDIVLVLIYKDRLKKYSRFEVDMMKRLNIDFEHKDYVIMLRI